MKNPESAVFLQASCDIWCCKQSRQNVDLQPTPRRDLTRNVGTLGARESGDIVFHVGLPLGSRGCPIDLQETLDEPSFTLYTHDILVRWLYRLYYFGEELDCDSVSLPSCCSSRPWENTQNYSYLYLVLCMAFLLISA